MAKRELEIGAQIPLNVSDVQDAIVLWVKKEFGIDIEAECVRWDHSGDYDRREFDGATVVLGREALKDLLNKEG